MSSRAGVCLMVIAALVLLAALAPTAALAAADNDASVIVHQKVEDTGAVYIEGYAQFVELHSEGGTLGPKEFTGEAPVTFSVTPGDYTVVSYTRAGRPPEPRLEGEPRPTERALGPPNSHCRSATLQPAAGEIIEVTVVVRPGKACEVATSTGGDTNLPRTGGVAGARLLGILLVGLAAIGVSCRPAVRT